MIFQTPFRHIFINQKPVIALSAVANKFHQISMVQLAKIRYFRLQNKQTISKHLRKSNGLC
ncbi:hypothetical protein HanIR_Chr17g0863491 [Helianthus annuus]|nr:hypothetical protein HanIR_Chr17g0863491 [Helianthus annuus]